MMSKCLQSVGCDISKLKVKVTNTKPVKGKTRITMRFSDKSERDAIRWKLIDQDNNYEPQAEFNFKPVEVWTMKPKYEIERDNKLHNMATTVAHTLGLNKNTDLVIDTKHGRTVCKKSDGVLLAHQDKNDWSPHYTAASGVKR